jgi:hypothetical protein
MVLTLEVHHIEYVSEGGGNGPDNLLVLCPNCHTFHHSGHIPRESLRSWKFLLLALNEAFDRRSIDTILALHALGGVVVWGDGLLACAALVASGLVSVEEQDEFVEMEGILGKHTDRRTAKYWIELSARGKVFVEGWKRGDQRAALHDSPGPAAAV